MAARYQRRLFYPLLMITVSLMISTVYLRYHYVIDVIAGVLLAVWCLGVTFWLYREHEECYPALALSTHSGSEPRA
jgi:membrane-associated phospholipid phosphatase